MTEDEQVLESLVEAVTASRKYRHVSPELVRTIGAGELAKGVSKKAAVKATKNKLHQVGGAYQTQRIDYDWAFKRLQTADSAESGAEWRDASREIMRLHVSTRERLPIMDEFYATILAAVPAPRLILDVACGLNPLAIPWMPLADKVSYIAYDIYGDMMQFLQSAMQLAGIDGQADVRDVIHDPPRDPADLALLLKTLPCIEQIQKGASARLLDSIQAHYLLISYPVSSLGGRQKGMVATYDAQFQTLSAGRNWASQRFLFDSELAFLVDTQVELGNDAARI